MASRRFPRRLKIALELGEAAIHLILGFMGSWDCGGFSGRNLHLHPNCLLTQCFGPVVLPDTEVCFINACLPPVAKSILPLFQRSQLVHSVNSPYNLYSIVKVSISLALI